MAAGPVGVVDFLLETGCSENEKDWKEVGVLDSKGEVGLDIQGATAKVSMDPEKLEVSDPNIQVGPQIVEEIVQVPDVQTQENVIQRQAEQIIQVPKVGYEEEIVQAPRIEYQERVVRPTEEGTTNPIQKIIELLPGPQARIIADGEAEEKQFNEYFEGGDDATKEKHFEIKTLKGGWRI